MKHTHKSLPRRNRILAILLAVALSVSTLTMFALPSHAETHSGEYGDNITWSFDEATGVLTLNGTGEMMDPGAGYVPWHGMLITEVKFEGNITGICSGAFADLWTLLKIELPDSITRIESGTFSGCSLLADFDIPAGVTYIGNGAFCNCSSLNEIILPPNINYIGNSAFSGCTSLESIFIPGNNTIVGNGAFQDCYALKSVTVDDGVIELSNSVFETCELLTTIELPDSLLRIGDNAFTNTGYSNEESNWENGVLYIGNHLICTDYYIPDALNIKDGTILIADSAFCGNSPSTLTMPNSVKHIGSHAFGDSELTNIQLSDALTSIGDYAFSSTGIKQITLPDTLQYIGECALDSTPYFNNIDNWDNATVYEGKNAVLYNGKHLIRANYDIFGEYTVSDGTLTIAAGAFYDCGSVRKIVLPDSITSICENSFSNCSSLLSINIPDNITIIDSNTFNSCDSLESIVLPNALEIIGDGAFYGCGSLTEVIIPDSVHSIGDFAFDYCSELQNITIPRSVIYIGQSAIDDWKSTIHGYLDTAAEKYAFENEIPFVDLDYVEPEPEPDPEPNPEPDPDPEPNPDPEPDPEPEPLPFTDVKEKDWYYSAVRFAVDNELFNGVSPTLFAPNTAMTRAMLVTVLWRMEGCPDVTDISNPFKDVKDGEYYTDAVMWASANNIVNGVGAGKFNPNGNITREQMSTILYRYSNEKGFDTSSTTALSSFSDGDRASKYAIEALGWACAEELIKGTRAGNSLLLDPQGKATRAQVATILMRYCKKYTD